MRWVGSLVKDGKYKDTRECLGRINTLYWLSYVYFNIMGGANIPTNKFGLRGTGALRVDYLMINNI